MVTHNMQQAVRVSDKTVFFLLGEVIESGETERLFSVPQDKRTEDYITGRLDDTAGWVSYDIQKKCRNESNL